MSSRARKRGGLGLIVLIALVVLFSAAFLYFSQSEGNLGPEPAAVETPVKSPLKAYFIDVGQADCELLVSGSESLLIDAGEAKTADAVIEYMLSLGITELTYVVATHPHSDHIGGMSKIINAFPIKNFIAPDVTHTSKTFEGMLDALEKNNVEITIANPGDEYSLGGASFTILSPPPENEYNELNNYSVVLKAEYGDTSILLTGDAEEAVENELLAGGFDLNADILKAGHHGSRTSSTQEFVHAVSPGFVIISCGADNSYGHPHEETLEKFENIDGQIYQTSIHGTVTAVSDGKTITITAEK